MHQYRQITFFSRFSLRPKANRKHFKLLIRFEVFPRYYSPKKIASSMYWRMGRFKTLLGRLTLIYNPFESTSLSTLFWLSVVRMKMNGKGGSSCLNPFLILISQTKRSTKRKRRICNDHNQKEEV